MNVDAFIKQQGIGLTGGIATGKTTVTNILRREGFLVFDADQFAREVVQPTRPALAEIVSTFGQHLVLQDQTLDRRELGKIVFNNPEKRATLEAILHPAIAAAFHDEIIKLGLLKEKTPKPFFYDAALLFEANTAHKFREIWVTSCTPQTQLRRLMTRNKIEEGFAKAMIAQQLPLAEKEARATVVINTEGDLNDVERRVLAAIHELKTREDHVL